MDADANPPTLTVNGQPEALEPQASGNLTVTDLLERHGLARQPVAVEVNRQLIPKARHGDTVLRPGDEVELVTLVGGG